MTKLTIFAALFAALIVVSSATTYTTVVTTTTTTDEAANPRTESCEQEIERMEMQHCKQWMMQMGGRSLETPFLRSAVSNPRYQEEHLSECCREMSSVPSKCRCEAIRKLVSSQQGKMEEEMEKMMMRKAMALPQMCRWESPTECSMRAVFY